jgi:hypothetical protein
VDNVTFGIRGGQTFALMPKAWEPAMRIEWAQANILFYKGIIDSLERWGKRTAEENGLFF